jgi:hypothetical protein
MAIFYISDLRLVLILLWSFTFIDGSFVAFRVPQPLPNGRGTAFMPYPKRERGVDFT